MKNISVRFLAIIFSAEHPNLNPYAFLVITRDDSNFSAAFAN